VEDTRLEEWDSGQEASHWMVYHFSSAHFRLVTAWERYIRDAENLCSSKWHCLDFIWSIINHIYPFLSHFDFMKHQKFETKFVIWKGSRSPNQVKMTQYSIFYCIIDQNGLKRVKLLKQQSFDPIVTKVSSSTNRMTCSQQLNFLPVGWRTSSIIEHDQTMACFFSQRSSPIMILQDTFK
jgi:hypothetical protein